VVELSTAKIEGCIKSLGLALPQKSQEPEPLTSTPTAYQAGQQPPLEEEPPREKGHHYSWEQWRKFSYEERKKILHVRKLNKKKKQNQI